MKYLKLIDKYLEESLCVILFMGMTSLVFFQVLSRFIFNYSIHWSEELARFSFAWLVYLAASMAIKHRKHIRVQVAEIFLPRKIAAWIGIVADTIWLALTVIMALQGKAMAERILFLGQTSPSLEIPIGYVYSIIPIGFGLMAFRLLQQLIIRFKEVLSGNIEERKIAID